MAKRSDRVSVGCISLYIFVVFISLLLTFFIDRWLRERADRARAAAEPPRIDLVVVNGQGSRIISSENDLATAVDKCVKVSKVAPAHQARIG